MKHPKVTVGITVKNSAATIKQCIDSIQRQSYKNFEVLVVDAFSNDGTWEILKSYGKKIGLIQKAGNISVGRNEIIKFGRGELIAFTDSDCIVDKNWLKNLVQAFSTKEIVAAGGFCGTPAGVNFLQQMIGKELENRFKKFPKFVSRLPFMNLCVAADAARKTLLDENLGAAEDADFGYRLTERGKMIYVPEAKVWHYHRGSLRSFFKQQFNYGVYAPLMYLKFKGRAGGDHISKPTMIIQPPLFLLGLLFAIFSYFYPIAFLFCSLAFLALVLIYFYDSIRLSKSAADFVAYLGLFLLRTIAWSIGFIFGIKNIFVARK